MRRAACERWATLSDRDACGEPLSEDEGVFLERHLARCGNCATEARVWEGLADVLRTPERLTAPVALGVELRPAKAIRRAVERSWPWLAAAAIVASLGSLWVWKEHAAPPERLEVTARAFPPAALVLASGEVVVEGRGDVVAGVSLSAGDVLRVGRGQACLHWEGSVLCAGPASELTFPADSGTPKADTTSAAHQVVSLRTGLLVAQVTKQSPERRFVVETPGGSVTVQGTLFAVAIEPDGRVGVRVGQGAVVVRSSGGAERLVRASRAVEWKDSLREGVADEALLARDLAWMQVAMTLGGDGACALEVASEPAGADVGVDGRPLGVTPLSAQMACGARQVSVQGAGFVEQVQPVVLTGARTHHRVQLERVEPSAAQALPAASSSRGGVAGPSPGELLALARRHRSAGRPAEAASVYRRLVAEQGGTPEAGTALVSLGELELSHLGAPAAALRSFESYLKRGGPLAPEAHYGQIRALRKLGRHDEERAAIDRFVQSYPKSAQAAQLRAQHAAEQSTSRAGKTPRPSRSHPTGTER